MNYISTRGNSESISFTDALAKGLAPDGGLYVPETFPSIDVESFRRDDLANGPATLAEFSAKLLKPFVESSPLASQIDDICAQAMNFAVPLNFLAKKPNMAVLELYHGPTAAFKDVGARFLAQCQQRMTKKATVIVATSGDTGGAVAAAFANQPGMSVVVLYPKGMISARQEKQLTNWGPSVRAFAVRGTFDDCQRLVKEVLATPALVQKHGFISANSISIGRLLPQMCYHAKAALDYVKQTGKRPTLVIPTGNLGNAVAALWAKRLKFPIERFVLATNANSTIYDYFQTGHYTPGKTIPTLANAMDVSAPSNFERLKHLYALESSDLTFLKDDVAAVSVSDLEIEAAIREGKSTYGEIWCPHTATAVVAKENMQIEHAIICATAHPAKFETIVEPLIGHALPVPPNLAATLQGVSHTTDLEPTFKAITDVLT